MAAATGPVDHAVDDIEIAPAALFIVGVAAHQPLTGFTGTLLGKIVLQQLHHRRQPLADLPVAKILRTRYQIVRQYVELAGGDIHLRQIRHAAVADPAHKAGVAQTQDRHQPNQMLRKIVGLH